MSLPRVNSIDILPYHHVRGNSVTSSLYNLYNQYEIHINILKWTGVIVLFCVTASTLGVTSNLYIKEKSHNGTDCIKIYQSPQLNSSLCSYIETFRLPSDYFLTVCKYQSSTIIDIRQFLNNKPSIRGISLTSNQWTYIQSIRQHITRALHQANYQ